MFFSIPLHPESFYKFAFTYNDQQLIFTRVAQDYHNAPSICHKIVAGMWKDLPHKNNIISYVDDVLVATTTRKQNLEALNEVLQRIKDTRFLINPPKAHLAQQRALYLGVELDTEGRRPDAAKVDLICKRPAPTDVSMLCSFLR